MNPFAKLFRTLAAEVERGRRVALCTVVSKHGSAPQSAGATMLLHEDMRSDGTLGGGCVEAEVRKRAHAMLKEGQSGLLHFDLDHDYGWDDGLICGGRMRIAVCTIADEEAARPFVEAAAQIQNGRRTDVRLNVLIDDEPKFYELSIEPPARLLIAGAGHVGAEVARKAVDLDFDVFVIDDRADLMNRERLPEPITPIVGDIAAMLRRQKIDANTFVVVVTRGHNHDEQALHAVIESNARYLGMIGSRRKVKLIFDDLEALGVDRAHLERVKSPIGLPIGAVTVPEIAVSILAQLIEVRRDQPPTHVEGPFDP